MKSRNINIFLIWWFSELYFNLIKIVSTNRAVILFQYICYITLFIIALWNNKFKVKRNFMVFSLGYLSITLINTMCVSYPTYVLVESITAFCVFLAPVYIFSTDAISVEELLYKWNRWAIIHTIFLPFFSLKIFSVHISYGIYASVTVLNIVVLMITYFKVERKVVTLFCIIYNFLILLIKGSRMPMAACVVLGIILVLFPLYKKRAQKMCMLAAGSIILLGTLLNIKQLLIWANDYLLGKGITSRTIQMLLQDLGNKSMIEMAGSSGRDWIWEIALDAIKEKKGLPMGFGVIRNMTNGQIYFSHNIFLDMWIIMGIFTIILVMAGGYVYLKKKRKYSNIEKTVLNSFGIYFFLCSLTGAHFLSDRYAVVFWGMLFFYGGEKRIISRFIEDRT